MHQGPFQHLEGLAGFAFGEPVAAFGDQLAGFGLLGLGDAGGGGGRGGRLAQEEPAQAGQQQQRDHGAGGDQHAVFLGGRRRLRRLRVVAAAGRKEPGGYTPVPGGGYMPPWGWAAGTWPERVPPGKAGAPGPMRAAGELRIGQRHRARGPPVMVPTPKPGGALPAIVPPKVGEEDGEP